MTRSKSATENAQKLVGIGRKLAEDGASAIRFWRLDRSPADWVRLNEPMRQWARRNAERVPAVLRVLNNAEFFFGPVQPGDITYVAMNRSKYVSYSAADLGDGHMISTLFARYAPLLLLELHGTKAESEGDHKRAAELYFAAIRGYWKTVSSDRPGPDLQLAYAAAGHICRRVGRMATSLQTKGDSRGRDFIVELERIVSSRPTLHDANTWNREVCFELVGRPSRQYDLRVMDGASGFGHDLGRAWLADPVAWHNFGERQGDPFTFGLRDRQLIQWMWSRHSQAIHQHATPLAGVGRTAESLNGLKQSWILDADAGHFANTTLTSADYWFNFDVVGCLYADFDLRTDMAAARQLLSFASQIVKPVPSGISTENPAAAGYRKLQLETDPWSGSPFVLQPVAAGQCNDAWGEPIPEGTIVLKSHGSIPKQGFDHLDADPDMLTGGPRYYVPPKSLQRLLQKAHAAKDQ